MICESDGKIIQVIIGACHPIVAGIRNSTALPKRVCLVKAVLYVNYDNKVKSSPQILSKESKCTGQS